MSTDTTPDKALSLVPEILGAHKNAVDAAKGSYKYAIECGELLSLAKETVKATHKGNRLYKILWGKWQKEHLPTIPQTTASLYMRLAKAKADGLLPDPKAINKEAGEGTLSIRVAAALIRKPRDNDNEDEDEDETDEGADESTDEPAVALAAPPPDLAPHVSPDLAALLENSAPDEVFIALKDKWDQDNLNALAQLLDEYLNQPQAQAA
jgi:hypothetical protein